MKKIIITNCAALFALGICELSAFDYSSGSAAETTEAAEENNWLFDSSTTEAKPSVVAQKTTKAAPKSSSATAAVEESDGNSWFFDSDKNESIASADKKEFKESADACEYEKTGKEALEDFYVAAGLCYSNTKADSEFKEDNIGNYKRFDTSNIKSGKGGGSFALGWGTFVTGNFYAGGEFLVDVIGRKTSADTKDILGVSIKTEVKTGGVIPTLALRFGGYCDTLNTLFFAKIGMARISSEYKDTTDFQGYTKNNFTMTKVTPIIGLGVETKVGPLGLRIDYDYRFKTDKDGLIKDEPGDYNYTANHKVKGYAVRLMATYHLSI